MVVSEERRGAQLEEVGIKGFVIVLIAQFN